MSRDRLREQAELSTSGAGLTPAAGRQSTLVLGSIPFVVALGVWELLGWLNLQTLRYVIPTPESVVMALYDDFSSGTIWTHVAVTLEEVAYGLVIAIAAALVLGVLIGRSDVLERAFYPIIVFFQAIPKVALAPLWLIVFGFGIGSKVALAAMVGFFPLLVGVIVGMAAMRRDEVELMHSLKATPWQIFVKVQLPRALPSIFGGLEVGALFALIGAVVGEFVGAQAGLGYLIQFRSTRLDLPGIFSPLAILALIGLVLDLGAKAIGRRLMTWEGE